MHDVCVCLCVCFCSISISTPLTFHSSFVCGFGGGFLFFSLFAIFSTICPYTHTHLARTTRTLAFAHLECFYHQTPSSSLANLFGVMLLFSLAPFIQTLAHRRAKPVRNCCWFVFCPFFFLLLCIHPFSQARGCVLREDHHTIVSAVPMRLLMENGKWAMELACSCAVVARAVDRSDVYYI